MDTQRQKQLLELLAQAYKNVENGEEISTEFARIFFPAKRKEYELTYYGKESQQAIIANTFAAPIQIDRSFGQATEDGWLNKIIFGDNLQVLKYLIEMKKKGNLKNSDGTNGVRLIYIDPPFATKQDFSNKDQKAYADKLKGAEFLEWLRKRLILLREVLSDDGTIYVHLDWHKAHYIKILMDEIFGEGNFTNEIIWRRKQATAFGNSKFGITNDTILMYRKSENYVFNQIFSINDENTKKYINERFNNVEPETNRKYMKSPLVNSLNRPNLKYVFQGINPPEKGWLYSKERMQELFDNGELLIPADPNARIYRKIYLDTYRGQAIQNLWLDIPIVNPMAKERKNVNYPTQKPEKLLERIIEASSNTGDLVLDVFGGSGTTVAVAEKLKRKWITVDVGKLSIYTMQKRILNIEGYAGFAVYNSGHYDENKLHLFEADEWKEFAMALYDVEPKEQIIKGFNFEGIKDGSLVKVYAPQEFKENAKITEETLEDLYSRLESSIGSEVFIIAPQGKFSFAVDEYDNNGQWDVIFNILRVPYSMYQKFTEKFSAIKQAEDSDSVNEAIDAVGFDFIRRPKVEFEIENYRLTVKSFEAFSRIKNEYKTNGFEAFAMILIDYNYDGETFKMDEVYFHKDFDDSQSVDFDESKIKGQMMLIFVDKFGNEFKITQGA